MKKELIDGLEVSIYEQEVFISPSCCEKCPDGPKGKPECEEKFNCLVWFEMQFATK